MSRTSVAGQDTISAFSASDALKLYHTRIPMHLKGGVIRSFEIINQKLRPRERRADLFAGSAVVGTILIVGSSCVSRLDWLYMQISIDHIPKTL
jgi:hypothetical protein